MNFNNRIQWLHSGNSTSQENTKFTNEIMFFFKTDYLIYPMYKSTFYSVKIGSKYHRRLINGSKTEIKKIQDKFLVSPKHTWKQNSKIKDKFFKKILTQKI